MFNKLFAIFVITLICLMSLGFIVAQDQESNYSYISDQSDLSIDKNPVVFSVGVNNYPDSKDYSKTKNIDGWVNMYTVTPVSSGVYKGVLKETYQASSNSGAKFTIEYGKMVNFVGFKTKVAADNATTWVFSAPPHKHFGKTGALCQINFLDTETKMICKNCKGKPSCATSLSTPYQDNATFDDEKTTTVKIPQNIESGITQINTSYGSDTINTNTKINGRLFDFRINWTPINGDESCKSMTDDIVSVNSYALSDGTKNCLIAADKTVFGNNLKVPVIVGSNNILPIKFKRSVEKVEICTGYINWNGGYDNKIKLLSAEGKLRIWSNKTGKPFAEIFFKKPNTYAAYCIPIEFNFPDDQYLTQIDIVYFSKISGDGEATLNSLKYEIDNVINTNSDVKENISQVNTGVIKCDDETTNKKIADLEAKISRLEETITQLLNLHPEELNNNTITSVVPNIIENIEKKGYYSEEENTKVKIVHQLSKKVLKLYVPVDTPETQDMVIATELENTKIISDTPVIDPCKLGPFTSLQNSQSILCNEITNIVCDESCNFYELDNSLYIKSIDDKVSRVKDLTQIYDSVNQGIKQIELSYSNGKFNLDVLRERNNFITKLILPKVSKTKEIPLRAVNMGLTDN